MWGYVLDGLSVGCLYAFIALGYTMVYGIIKLINFAHGEVFMVGAFISMLTLRHVGNEGVHHWLLAAALAAAGCGVLAVTIEKLCYKPLRGRGGKIAALLAALGVSLFLQNFTAQPQIMGASQQSFPDPAGLSVAARKQIILGALIFSTAVLYVLVKHTRAGKAMRAVSFDVQTARLMGVNVDRTISFTFFVGAALAGIGGLLWGLRYGKVEPWMGMLPGLKAFIAAVLGGMGSINGAVVGGLILGVLEAVTTGLLPEGYSGFRDVVAFVVLIVILLVRPSGLFGRFEGEKV